MAREDLHFRLRIPAELKSRIEEAAQENHRSMTAEMIAALELSYPEPIDTDATIATMSSDEIRVLKKLLAKLEKQ